MRVVNSTSMPKKKFEIRWLHEPEEQDYPAAESYLNLIYDKSAATLFVRKLRHAPLTNFKAKDIFRASGLALLVGNNPHVEKDQERIQAGQKLSPLLLVRDPAHSKVIIADGYHRLCATYSYNEDAIIPCKIV